MMYTENEAIKLSWNNFQTSVTESFRRLHNAPEFSDVTLACGDGHQIEAHKVILSSSSPFFQKILTRNNHQHPLIYLKGVDPNNLAQLIQFIYTGEVQVQHEALERFLEAANELEVEGLRKAEETEEMRTSEIANKKDPESFDGVDEQIEQFESELMIDEDDEKSNENTTDVEPWNIVEEEVHCTLCDLAMDSRTALKKHNREVHQTAFNCDFCSFKSKFQANLKRHTKSHSSPPIKEQSPETNAEIKLETEEPDMKTNVSLNTGKFICTKCNKELATKASLRVHMEATHEGLKFPCDRCHHQASNKGNLERHKKNIHLKQNMSDSTL